MRRLFLRWLLRSQVCRWCGDHASTIREEHLTCDDCAEELDEAAGEVSQAHFSPLRSYREEVYSFAAVLSDVFAALEEGGVAKERVDVVASVMVAEATLRRIERAALARPPGEELADNGLDEDLYELQLTCSGFGLWRCDVCGALLGEDGCCSSGRARCEARARQSDDRRS